MKRLALLLASTAFAAPAFAADAIIYQDSPAPAPMAFVEAPAPSFTGFYLGVQAGGAFNDDGEDLDINPSFGDVVISGGGDAFRDNFASEFEGGFIGGAHAGYDYQFGAFVLGAIVDINATDISYTQSAFSNTPAFYTVERELDYLVTGRLRGGAVITDRALAYVTGGFAYGEIDYSFRTDSPLVSGNPRSNAISTPAVIREDEDDFGYTVGAGMEVLVTDNLSFGAEYLYTDLGDSDSSTRLNAGAFAGGVGGFTDFDTNDDFDFHTITAKLSYRFN